MMAWRARHAAIEIALDDLTTIQRVRAWHKNTTAAGTVWNVTVPPFAPQEFTTADTERLIDQLRVSAEWVQLNLLSEQITL